MFPIDPERRQAISDALSALVPYEKREAYQTLIENLIMPILCPEPPPQWEPPPGAFQPALLTLPARGISVTKGTNVIRGYNLSLLLQNSERWEILQPSGSRQGEPPSVLLTKHDMKVAVLHGDEARDFIQHVVTIGILEAREYRKLYHPLIDEPGRYRMRADPRTVYAWPLQGESIGMAQGFVIPEAWNSDEILDYLLTGKHPDQTHQPPVISIWTDAGRWKNRLEADEAAEDLVEKIGAWPQNVPQPGRPAIVRMPYPPACD